MDICGGDKSDEKLLVQELRREGVNDGGFVRYE
jgi:hypothetical protein